MTSVRGHKIAGAQLDNVADYDLIHRDRNNDAVTAHVGADGDRALQSICRKLCAVLLHHVENDRKRDDAEDDSEARKLAGESRDRSRDEQNGDQWFDEAPRNFDEDAPLRRIPHCIQSPPFEPRRCFRSGQTGGGAGDLLVEGDKRRLPETISHPHFLGQSLWAVPRRMRRYGNHWVGRGRCEPRLGYRGSGAHVSIDRNRNDHSAGKRSHHQNLQVRAAIGGNE